MNKIHPLKGIIEKQKKGIAAGICSICSANEYVIEAAMQRALSEGTYVLIEATANQVNQYGGYTGMKPADFMEFALSIARKTNFPEDRLILGGDHLGPLTWKNENSAEAMEKSAELIRQYVAAGFTKIHIDTSMHLADDDKNKKLDTKIVAQRGAVLCAVAEEAFRKLKESNPEAIHPVYIVGSEVPIPGGSQDEEEGLTVTSVNDFEDTVEVYRELFLKAGLDEAWDNVIAVVVQPGVEFGDETIHEYDREAAKELSNALKKHDGLVFEGHSTDYQTAFALRQMVEDGIAILKVGPALTFSLREGIFMLAHMERELLAGKPDYKLSNFIDVLENAMISQPDNWKKHYHGTEEKLKFARKYSYSDRCRYYLPVPEVDSSLKLLISNLKKAGIPLTLISQYMPVQYRKIREGLLENDPEALLKDKVDNLLDDYYYAVSAGKA